MAKTNSNSATARTGSATPEGVLAATDHKSVGRLFIGAGALLTMVGLVLSVVASLESADLESFAIVADADEFTQVWSIGRDLLLVGGIVPMLVGLGIYLVPLQVGSPTLVFARGAAASFWTWALGSALLIAAYAFNGGPGGGRRDFVVLWAAALAMMLGGLVWAMICIATTVLGARTQGMTLERVPLTTWSMLIFSVIGLSSLPVVIAELLLTYLRVRFFHLPVSESEVATGVLNSLTTAPAAYWIGIPILGIAADIIATQTGVRLRFHRVIMGAIGLFGLLTFFPDLVGFSSVRDITTNNGLMVITLLVVSVPVLATLAMVGDSIRAGAFVPRAPMIGALVSGLLLLVATAASILAQVDPIIGFLHKLFPDSIDLSNSLVLSGTTFDEGVRALAAGAAIVAVAAAVSNWGIKIFGRQPAQSMSTAAVLATAGGATLWGFAEIAAGFGDQPLYPAQPAVIEDLYGTFGFLAVIGSALMAVGAVALFGAMTAAALGRQSGSASTAWSGQTLEWATSSPPPIGNFDGPPVVTSPYPLADGELVYAVASDAVDPSADQEIEES